MNPVMRSKRSLGVIAAAIGLWRAGVAPSHAATLTYNPGYAPGI